MFFLFGYPFIFLVPLLLFFFVFRAGGRMFRSFDRPRRLEEEYHPSIPDAYRSYYRRGSTLESQVFKLAYRRKGRLTVSDIVIETGLGIDDAERLIQGMVDNARVRMEVDDRGLVVYEFPEIQSRFEDES